MQVRKSWRCATRLATRKHGIRIKNTQLYASSSIINTQNTNLNRNTSINGAFKRYYHQTKVTLQDQKLNEENESTSEEDELKALMDAPRESDQVDVLIVGGGPSGLSAAIRFMQLAEKEGKKEGFRVVVLEKAAEVGKHILSGACIEPRALEELIPDWKNKNPPSMVPVENDKFLYLTENSSFRLPTPPPMHNKGNYIVSLSDFTRWLGEQATELGVEIYPESPAVSFLPFPSSSSPLSSVLGVSTGPKGISRARTPKPSFSPSFDFHSHLTILAEGARGSMTKIATNQFDLRNGIPPQTYGLGIKELWQVGEGNKHYKKGSVVHTTGWPLDSKTYGGSWVYHLDDGLVSIGFVIGLDYENPWMSIYKEFQRFKHHPAIKPLLEGGTPIGYGARAIVEGGIQCVPKMHFPGGIVVGDSAGLLNVPKIKGTHNAMKSGMIAAETAWPKLKERIGSEITEENALDLKEYQDAVKTSWIWEDLYKIRNIRPSFKWGFWPALAYGALDNVIMRGNVPWTLAHGTPDHKSLKPADQCEKIKYPEPDGKISFDLLTNLTRSGTNHEEDQPVHLVVTEEGRKEMKKLNWEKYRGAEQRYCPAGVYEWVDEELVINAQNCVHCKTCDIKDVGQNINWVPPEGGGGPLYSGM
eukprot:TRINITY_DN3892_c0_g1_i1.p1 TRINITY_DN3892_c0_g1~~TRINITY_DN3892_c0_g1_i1.p1  ORF type:complete len:643 (+),score=178.32 TRINITY_DN3892_c0_g1_i1:39-1967(+)